MSVFNVSAQHLPTFFSSVSIFTHWYLYFSSCFSSCFRAEPQNLQWEPKEKVNFKPWSLQNWSSFSSSSAGRRFDSRSAPSHFCSVCRRLIFTHSHAPSLSLSLSVSDLCLSTSLPPILILQSCSLALKWNHVCVCVLIRPHAHTHTHTGHKWVWLCEGTLIVSFSLCLYTHPPVCCVWKWMFY